MERSAPPGAKKCATRKARARRRTAGIALWGDVLPRAILAALIALSATARAEDCPPEHAALGHCVPDTSPAPETDEPNILVTGTLGVVAATYRTPLFEGNYQGGIVGVGVARGRFAVSAQITEYRLARNGLASRGPGDVMLHGHVSLASPGDFTIAAMVMTSLPTGDDDRGFGMGHVMLMGDLAVSWTRPRFALSQSIGYGHAFGGADAHAEHGGGGGWPLVDPMNARELAFGSTFTYTVAPSLTASVRMIGAAPIGDGQTRLAAGGGVAWTLGRAVTSLEILGGIVGDPFGIRGVLTTRLRVF